METIEGFVNFVYLINFWMREQAQSQVCKHEERTTNVINGHYMLASPPTKQMVSNKCHEREHQVHQSHASGSDNFNGAEEVNVLLYLGYASQIKVVLYDLGYMSLPMKEGKM